MTKIISVSDEAYGQLQEIKKEHESFSKVILRVMEKEKRKPLMAFFGKWPGPTKELDQIKKQLEEDRQHFSMKEIQF